MHYWYLWTEDAWQTRHDVTLCILIILEWILFLIRTKFIEASDSCGCILIFSSKRQSYAWKRMILTMNEVIMKILLRDNCRIFGAHWGMVIFWNYKLLFWYIWQLNFLYWLENEHENQRDFENNFRYLFSSFCSTSRLEISGLANLKKEISQILIL